MKEGEGEREDEKDGTGEAARKADVIKGTE